MPGPGLPGWLALHCAVGLIGTWLARGYALRHALIDQPGARRSHVAPTPRGGGIAIAAALLLALAWLALADPRQAPLHAAIGVGLSLVAGIGWLDDHRPLSPWLRLATHAIAAALLAGAIVAVGGSTVVAVGAFALALVLVNVWNFMDGIDGLAASQAALVAVAYALFAGNGPVSWLGLALAAACAGFLPFNLPPARIFLGDVGSGTLGFALAALVSMLLLRVEGRQAPLLLLPLCAFAVDAALTLGARMLRGERWWLPHTQHAYQRWARSGSGHARATAGYAGWTLAAGAIMLAARSQSGAVIMGAVGGVYLAACVAWWRLQGMAGRTMEDTE